MQEMLSQLNPAQKQAVLHTEGPLLILAGAGSGKTRVLTNRMAYLIEKGVEPFRILAITFTNKAANEMKRDFLSFVSRRKISERLAFGSVLFMLLVFVFCGVRLKL
jgi:DNA helicase-2/ATP-dependent DNA helicase PcrA